MTDDDVEYLARECLLQIATTLELPEHVTIREVDGCIEFLINTPNSDCGFFYRPQHHAEQIVREHAELIATLYATVKDEAEADERDYVFSEYQYIIENLLKEFLFSCCRDYKKQLNKFADKILNMPSSAAAKTKAAATRAFRPSEYDYECQIFARTVNKIKPLWNYVSGYFKNNLYDGGAFYSIRRDEQFCELAQGWNITDDLLRLAFNEERNAKNAPLSIALEHARREIGIRDLQHYALVRLYYDGKRGFTNET